MPVARNFHEAYKVVVVRWTTTAIIIGSQRLPTFSENVVPAAQLNYVIHLFIKSSAKHIIMRMILLNSLIDFYINMIYNLEKNPQYLLNCG